MVSLYAESKGAVWVDAGAAEALLDHGKSLLISGVTKAEGDFLIKTSSASIIKSQGNY